MNSIRDQYLDKEPDEEREALPDDYQKFLDEDPAYEAWINGNIRNTNKDISSTEQGTGNDDRGKEGVQKPVF